MHATIILVGDELLAGHTRDANGHFLAKRLHELGHRVRRIIVVPDEARAMMEEIDRALRQSSVVFLCGGLGPTHDDRTTEVVAERFSRGLIVDEAAWESMRERYGKRLKVTPEVETAARKMVMVPEGAEVLENPVGAAVGYVLREGGSSLVVLPGVPAELQAIFDQRVVGRYLPTLAGGMLLEVDVEMPEAQFAGALGDVANAFGDVEIGSYPHFGERRVTLRFRGELPRAKLAFEAFLARVPEAKQTARVLTKETDL